MRFARPAAAMLLALSSLAGCEEKQAEDPGEILRASNMIPFVETPSHEAERSVRVGADARGALYVQAPPGSRIVQPYDARYPAEAEILLPPPSSGRPHSISLGYCGDGPLEYGVMNPSYQRVSKPAAWHYEGRARTFH